MKRKILFSLALVLGFSIPLATSSFAGICKTGTVKGVGVEAVLNKDGDLYKAGTYAYSNVDYIYVSLNGTSDNTENGREAYVKRTINEPNVWTDHQVKHLNSDWTKSLGYQNGVFKER